MRGLGPGSGVAVISGLSKSVVKASTCSVAIKASMFFIDVMVGLYVEVLNVNKVVWSKSRRELNYCPQ